MRMCVRRGGVEINIYIYAKPTRLLKYLDCTMDKVGSIGKNEIDTSNMSVETALL